LDFETNKKTYSPATRFSSSSFKNTHDTSLTTTPAVTNYEGSVGEIWANFAKENQNGKGEHDQWKRA